MYARHATRTVSKFCHNCGALVRMVTTKADVSKPEMCQDCIPYYRIAKDSEAQIDMLRDRHADAVKKLEQLKTDTHLGISRAIAIN